MVREGHWSGVRSFGVRSFGFAGAMIGVVLGVSGGASGFDWRNWRGPLQTGEAPGATPPVTWSDTQNIAWKAEIPGLGSATPIVVGDLVILPTAIDTGRAGAADARPSGPQRSGAVVIGQQGRPRRPGGGQGRPGGPGGAGARNVHEFVLMAYDRNTGQVKWRKTLHQQVPTAGIRPGDGTYSSASAVSDGERVWAYYGSYGVYCLDLEGNVLWSKQLPPMRKRNEFGEGESPAYFNNTLVFVRDHEGGSHITALNASTGDELWTRPRRESSTWATPLILEVNGKAQAIVPATGRCVGYDLQTGEEVWTGPGLTANAIPSPAHSDGIVYLTSGFRGYAMIAVDIAKATGDISDSGAIVWRHDRQTPYVPSPLVYEGAIYFIADNAGVISCLDAKTGEPWYAGQRIPLSTVYASPVAANGHVYIAGRDGKVVVLKHGRSFEQVAVNEINDAFDGSPVIVGDQIFLRGANTLYCVAAR